MTRLALFAFLFSATAAEATTCGQHDKLSAELKENHGEEPVVILVQPNGAILHVLANPKKRIFPGWFAVFDGDWFQAHPEHLFLSRYTPAQEGK